MKNLDAFLWPYIISQLFSLLILYASWKSTPWARLLFFILFLWAACTNMYISLTNPGAYLQYADMAIPAYRRFIDGWFGRHIGICVPMIAIGQFLIAIGMLLNRRWVSIACIGSILFLLAIAPLMTGSAFPFSITTSIAAWRVLQKDKKDLLFLSFKSKSHQE